MMKATDTWVCTSCVPGSMGAGAASPLVPRITRLPPTVRGYNETNDQVNDNPRQSVPEQNDNVLRHLVSADVGVPKSSQMRYTIREA